MTHKTPVLQRALGVISGRGMAGLEQAGLAVIDKAEYEQLVARCNELERARGQRRRITWNELEFDADPIHLALLDHIKLLTKQRDSRREERDELRRLLQDHHEWIAAAMRRLLPLNAGWMSPVTFSAVSALFAADQRGPYHDVDTADLVGGDAA